MTSKKPHKTLSAAALIPLFLALAALSLTAQALTAQVATSKGPQYRLAPSQEPILELVYQVDMLAEAVPPLRYQLFADGILVAHVPPTWKNAGRFERQFSVDDVERLISSLLDAGALDTSSSQIEAEVGAIERQRVAKQLQYTQNKAQQRPPEVFAVSDDETLEIRLRLDRFRAKGSSVALVNIEHTLAIDNLHVKADAYDELPMLRDFSNTVRQIENLADTESMSRREPAP